jgi:hypothetical protein
MNRHLLLLFLVLISISFPASNAFHSTGSKRLTRLTKLWSSGLNSLYELSQKVVVADNATATLVNLINLGDVWSLKSGNRDFDLPFQLSLNGFDRVPGCMADARVKTNLMDVSDGGNEARVEISGWADSRVAQGMLALLSQVLNTEYGNDKSMPASPPAPPFNRLSSTP